MTRAKSDAARTCLGCRRTRPRAELIRIARGPGDTVCFDLEGRLPGRGCWVCPTPACVDALSAGAVGHVLRGPARLPGPAERRALLAEGLARRAGNLLTMARRMRAVTFGPAGARSALGCGRAKLLLLARDLPGDAAASWVARAGSVPVALVPAGAGAFGALAGGGPLKVAVVTAEGIAAAIAAAFDRLRAFSGIPCDNDKLDNAGSAPAARGSAAAGGGGGR